MDHHVETLLRDAGDDVQVGSPPVEELVSRGRRRVRRRRTTGIVGAAAAVAAVVAAVPVTRALDRDPAPPAATGGCESPVPERVLPSWAREGFSGERPRAAYVEGDRGHLLAVVFGPLTSPVAADRQNKVLWIQSPRRASEPPAGEADPSMQVVASSGTTRVVRTIPEGPGPSTLDLPRPGCWHLTVRWSGRTDTLDLLYR